MEATLKNLVNYNKETKKEEPVHGVEEIDAGTKLKVVNPVTFECYGRLTRVTNADVSRMIKGLFLPVFHDLVGVYFDWNWKYREWETLLVFEHNAMPCPSDKITSLETIAENTMNRGLSAPYAGLMQNTSKRIYKLNYETKCILAPFMYNEANSPDSKGWDNFEDEIHIPVNNNVYWNTRNADYVQYTVRGLNIYKLLRAIYGKRMVINTEYKEDGTVQNHTVDAMYNVNLAPSQPLQRTTGETCIQIEQIDKAAVDKIALRENSTISVNSMLKYY